MKRCPLCEFIYLDQDEVCDLDGSVLLVADEAELTRGTAPLSSKRKLLFGVTGAVLAGALVATAYVGLSGRFSRARTQNIESASHQAAPTPDATSTPTQMALEVEAPSPSPEISPVAGTRPTPSSTKQQTRGASSRNPSTGDADTRPGMVKIQMVNGATVVADEAWRTKQGVWYRRNGIVTLVKSDQVRAIERSKSRR